MVYADSDSVTALTSDLQGDNYDKILPIALKHADTKINSALRKEMIPTDPINNPDLFTNADIQEAGTLYATAFILDTVYNSNESPSPASTTYKSDANDIVQDYIDNYYKKDTNSGYTRSQSNKEATFMTRHHRRYRSNPVWWSD